ncbi:MAG: hypothetical protein DWQ47_03665 [Acidobacteria bacterium]|nr:MAG: hypothetical protein DWQ32_07215 [Acidobacteriota bacterium]REK01497.1 MAG: hypothetical protein DWQ38_03650 [Acidobacteriota bacterium]REK14453.1 MAG: hypothetical protein DWQ43_12905 [Acidobacteriota bacterium]REK45168.1 MAG: hypothetical protein DWQ47_03665 [Acidobacteriota bacterium]
MQRVKVSTRFVNNARFASVLAVFLLLASVSFSQQIDEAVQVGNYKIGPGDVIDVIVSKNPELSRTGLRVSNLGTVQLAMMDTDVQAACLTERELADRIKEHYRKYMVEPYVNVAVTAFNSSPVAVIGAVNNPGRFQLQRSINLAELLTFVNGTSANAGDNAEILRDTGRPRCVGNELVIPESGEDELISVNLAETFKRNSTMNPEIVPGDIIRVSTSTPMTAYIQGNVNSSIAIQLGQPTTLTQAIAMAGGPSQGANLSKVRIRRQIEGSVNREEMIVNVKDIIDGERDDVLIEPFDIIDVPGPSGFKKFFGDIFRAVVPTLTRVPVGVVPIP